MKHTNPSIHQSIRPCIYLFIHVSIHHRCRGHGAFREVRERGGGNKGHVPTYLWETNASELPVSYIKYAPFWERQVYPSSILLIENLKIGPSSTASDYIVWDGETIPALFWPTGGCCILVVTLLDDVILVVEIIKWSIVCVVDEGLH